MARTKSSSRKASRRSHKIRSGRNARASVALVKEVRDRVHGVTYQEHLAAVRAAIDDLEEHLTLREQMITAHDEAKTKRRS